MFRLQLYSVKYNKTGLQRVTETLEAHADDEIVLGVWLPGTASDLLAGARALPDADGWLL